MSVTSRDEFAAFYGATYRELVAFGERLVPGWGEDLVQTVCERLLSGSAAYCPDVLRPVAYRAVRNLAIDVVRREQRVRVEFTDFSDPASAELAVTAIDCQHAVDAVLQLLSINDFINAVSDGQERTILELRWLGEFNESEISVITGISRRSVRTHLRRARMRVVIECPVRELNVSSCRS